MTTIDPLLQSRDPILAAAVAAHGAEWRPDLQARLTLHRDDERRLPGVEMSSLEHRIEWRIGTGKAVLLVKWVMNDGAGRRSHWHGEFHMGPMPETLATALDGRSLDHLIDADGAGAWRIASISGPASFGVILSLERRQEEARHHIKAA